VRLSRRCWIGKRCSDIVLEFEFEKSLAWNEHVWAVRHHLEEGGSRACADCCASSPAADTAKDRANYGAAPDAFRPLSAAPIACNIILGRVERHDVSVDANSGQLDVNSALLEILPGLFAWASLP
jgi:hypothetical protein